MLRSLLPLLVLLPAITGCITPDVPADAADMAEKTQDISAVFESREAYSVHRLDSLDIEAFLDSFPGYRTDTTGIRNFYHRRKYQYAWFVNDSLSQSALGFFDLVNSADTAFKAVRTLRDQMRELLLSTKADGRSIALCDSCQLHLELALTAQFFGIADKKYGGVVGKDLRELDWFIPRRKKDISRLIDSLAAGHMDLSPLEPLHPQYRALKAQLRHYHLLDSLSDWTPISLGELRKLEPGQRNAIVPDLRQRLLLLGDLTTTGDTLYLNSKDYDSTLVAAVQRFQERHGLHPDGVVGKGVVAALNVTPSARLRTMLVNMERLRWVQEENAPDQVLVNIPEFRMHVFEDGREVLSMDVVVGTVATRTVIFSDSLSQIVFSPTWTIPKSIVQGEILPAMARDPNYLRKKNMEKIGGSAANPIIRQRPGASNALGRVKFLFPNSYSIYFHDTPSKGGFAREQRAFSHGCIRLSRPTELAEYLLRNDTAWTAAKIKEAMFSEKEKYVRLSKKRPVTIGYFTAWVDAQGRLNFRDDVYGHDQRLAQELFDEPVTPGPLVSAMQESTP